MTKELIDKAERALASARLLLADGDTDGATNRAYYAMFDAATAALVWAGVVTAQTLPKTHSGLISAFGLHLIQTGQLPAQLGRSFNHTHEFRLTADYLAEPVPADKAAQATEEAATFVAAIRDLVKLPAG